MTRWRRHDDVIFNACVILFYFKVCNNIISTKISKFAWNYSYFQGLYSPKLVMNCPFNKDSLVDIFTFNLLVNKTPCFYFLNYSCVGHLCSLMNDHPQAFYFHIDLFITTPSILITIFIYTQPKYIFNLCFFKVPT